MHGVSVCHYSMAEDNPAAQRQTAVTAYFEKWAVTVVCLCTVISMPVLDGRRESCSSKTNSSSCSLLKVSSYCCLSLHGVSVCHYSMAEENPAAQRQTAVTAYFTSKQLLLFVFARRFSMPVLDGRRESCSSKTNSSNCLLWKVSSYCCLSLHDSKLCSTTWVQAMLAITANVCHHSQCLPSEAVLAITGSACHYAVRGNYRGIERVIGFAVSLWCGG